MAIKELKQEDFKIGQKIGVIWSMGFGTENQTFRLRTTTISKMVITKKGTTIHTTPKIFRDNYLIEDEEIKDYRKIEGDLIMVDTPMLISDETEEYFKKVVERWNTNPPKSILD